MAKALRKRRFLLGVRLFERELGSIKVKIYLDKLRFICYNHLVYKDML